LNVSKTSFSKNKHRFGAGLYLSRESPSGATDATITNCLIQNNLASVGGFLYTSTRLNILDLYIYDSTFDFNNAQSSSDATADGGCLAFALSISTRINVTLMRNIFKNNAAHNNGAVVAFKASNPSGSFYVQNNAFTGNDGQNGGVFYFREILDYRGLNNYFEDNYASENGLYLNVFSLMF